LEEAELKVISDSWAKIPQDSLCHILTTKTKLELISMPSVIGRLSNCCLAIAAVFSDWLYENVATENLENAENLDDYCYRNYGIDLVKYKGITKEYFDKTVAPILNRKTKLVVKKFEGQNMAHCFMLVSSEDYELMCDTFEV
jgi:hypothetical protein